MPNQWPKLIHAKNQCTLWTGPRTNNREFYSFHRWANKLLATNDVVRWRCPRCCTIWPTDFSPPLDTNYWCPDDLDRDRSKQSTATILLDHCVIKDMIKYFAKKRIPTNVRATLKCFVRPISNSSSAYRRNGPPKRHASNCDTGSCHGSPFAQSTWTVPPSLRAS